MEKKRLRNILKNQKKIIFLKKKRKRLKNIMKNKKKMSNI